MGPAPDGVGATIGSLAHGTTPSHPAVCDADDLPAALRAQAKGGLCAEAAVELMIGHRSWLWRGDFTNRFVEVVDRTDGTTKAFVAWAEAVTALDSGALPCSSSEGQILRLAASIASGIPVNLGDAVGVLDVTNATSVARALLHASGHAGALGNSAADGPP